MQLLGRQQREAVGEVEAHLRAETAISVPVPVRSFCSTPWSRICCIRSRYWRIDGHPRRCAARSKSGRDQSDMVRFASQSDSVGLAGAAVAPSLAGMRYQRAEHPLKLDGLTAARELFRRLHRRLAIRPRDSLWVAHVDDEARCLHLSRHAGDEAAPTSRCAPIIADAAIHGSAGDRPGPQPPERRRPAERGRLPRDAPAGDRGRSARLRGPRPSGVRRRANAPACGRWACSRHACIWRADPVGATERLRLARAGLDLRRQRRGAAILKVAR